MKLDKFQRYITMFFSVVAAVELEGHPLLKMYKIMTCFDVLTDATHDIKAHIPRMLKCTCYNKMSSKNF